MIDQFRMNRLQVYNWGTFSALHDIAIAPEGFLFVGRSGSGKSTLLDAFSALLVPPRWHDFNAAARDAERTGRDRNLVSYVRGAWAEQKNEESGEIATCYLRPDTTRSILALTFVNGDEIVVLVRLYWLLGKTNSNNEVYQHGLIFERPFEVAELANLEFDVRKLKLALPEAHHSREFSAYQERFRGLLGIENESALRLLNKTQSAKNLGDLNVFLRDFMLEKPETFEASRRLVLEFAELNEAHQAVVTARRQVETLLPARAAHKLFLEQEAQQVFHQSLLDLVTPYAEELRGQLIASRLEQLTVQQISLHGQMHQATELLTNSQEQLRDLEQQHRDHGGDSIERWENEIRQQTANLNERSRRLRVAETACEKLGWSPPISPHRLAELIGQARQILDQYEDPQSSIEIRGLHIDEHRLSEELTELRQEIEALRRQPSSIPGRKLELRRRMSEALNVSEASLPFVGELVEVKKEEMGWRGAIERVLHGFALSILVEERNYPALAQWVNSHHIGDKLVYHRVTREERVNQPISHPLALVNKLNVQSGPFQPWVLASLRLHQDYHCVDSMTAFQQHKDKAITKQGQIRVRNRHEKDDRSLIDDPRGWVLGFDNREKMEAYVTKAQEVGTDLAAAKARLKALEERVRLDWARCQECQQLVNLEWSDIDVAPLHDRIAQLARQIQEAQSGSSVLQRLAEEIQRQKRRIHSEEDLVSNLKAEQKNNLGEQERLKTRLSQLNGIPLHLSDLQRDEMEQHFKESTLDNLDTRAREAERALNKQLLQVQVLKNQFQRQAESCFATFNSIWKSEAGDLCATLASAHDYFARLQRLERDGLPAFEERFFDLLQSQSTQNLVALNTQLSLARKQIQQRLDSVNEALGQTEFNQGTTLEIFYTDRQLPEVREFRQEIQEILTHSLSNERENAEIRFEKLNTIVDRLGSGETADRNWQQVVLDVRKHVEFIGHELDHDQKVIEVYRSGAGKSGGQRQKLATTCLAAALRYQLGGSDHRFPCYAPVVLDEAFDKADSEFTTLAMKIFKNFGFQMIVATPMKSVMTLEPFIGGACFVDISERHTSHIAIISYDRDQQRLQFPSEGEVALA